jgi:hypothetical protein
MVELTREEKLFLLTFDSDKPKEESFESVQCLTRFGLLEIVTNDPYTWKLSREGRLQVQAIRDESAKSEQEEKTEKREESRYILEQKSYKLSVINLQCSLAGFLLGLLAEHWIGIIGWIAKLFQNG